MLNSYGKFASHTPVGKARSMSATTFDPKTGLADVRGAKAHRSVKAEQIGEVGGVPVLKPVGPVTVDQPETQVTRQDAVEALMVWG